MTATRFGETNAVIYSISPGGHYASCRAGNCTWVGPLRSTVAAAKRDAVRHHVSDK